MIPIVPIVIGYGLSKSLVVIAVRLNVYIKKRTLPSVVLVV